jgi:hypothetical protein
VHRRGLRRDRDLEAVLVNVVQLNDFRKPRKPARQQNAPDSPRFFCLHCDGDTFKLYETGDVHCSCCGARIRNIYVAGKA